MKQLSAEDAFFFYIETPQQHQHTLGVLLLDPGEAGSQFSVKTLVDKMEKDIDILPDFRQRLHTLPFYVAPPALVDDKNFKFKNHVNIHTLPKPGTRKQLCELIDKISSEPLNKKKPLWEAWFIDGLEDGMVACATKSHHCMSDGVQGAEFMAEQFDFEPNPKKKSKEEKKDPWQAEKLSLFNVMSKTWQHHRKTQPGFGNMVSKTIRTFKGRRKTFKESEKARQLVPDIIPTAPKLKFNGAISGKRRVAIGKLPMADLKKIKNAYNVTFNDVVLTATAMSLRNMLIATNDLPDEPLICAVPVSMKLKGEEAREGQGNQVGNMLVKMPVQIKDPVKCLHAMHESTVAAKKMFDASFENLMMGYIGMMPPAVANLAMKTFMGNFATERMPTLSNLVVSNFPGPPIPLYMCGAKLDATFPIGPVMSGQGLNLTFMSGVNELDFSVHAAADKIDDVWSLADDLIGTTKQLLDAAMRIDSDPKKASAQKSTKAKSAAKKSTFKAKKSTSKSSSKAQDKPEKGATKKSPAVAKVAASKSAKPKTASPKTKYAPAKKRVTRSKNAPQKAAKQKSTAKRSAGKLATT